MGHLEAAGHRDLLPQLTEVFHQSSWSALIRRYELMRPGGLRGGDVEDQGAEALELAGEALAPGGGG